MEAQRAFWNDWNAAAREHAVGDVSQRQREVALGWLEGIGRRDLAIIDLGCGAGWFCTDLKAFGPTTGVDISDQVLERARERMPDVRFIAGDITTLDLGAGAFDVVVTLEVLSHVADQPAFMAGVARILKPGGVLIMATQNRPILERNEGIAPPKPGQIRKWVNKRELRQLLAPHFRIRRLRTLTPKGNRGFLRYVNSHKLNRIARMALGERAERVKEWLGFGWTLMVFAEKRG